MATLTNPNPDCIFCNIVTGSAPADIVFDGGDTLFFRDISPKARIHIVGIPKPHLDSLKDVRSDHHLMMGKLMHDVVHVATEQGLNEGGYRVLTNVGTDAGQQVNHLHFHIMGGESLGPLRC